MHVIEIPLHRHARYCAEAMLKPTRWTSRDDFTFSTVHDIFFSDCTVIVWVLFAAHEAEELALELSMKVAMNAVSTGANIMIGKVYGNTMINVTVANNKVCSWYRACVLAILHYDIFSSFIDLLVLSPS